MRAVGLALRAVRAPSLAAGALPALLAGALVVGEGRPFLLAPWLATLGGLLLLQSGVNLANDYFDDESGLDADPDFAASPFPLGSRVIQSGALSRRAVLAGAGACFALGAACGLWLDAQRPGHVVLALGAAGAGLGFFYTAPPLRIAYHGAGEPVIFLLFGPLAGLGAYYVQTGGASAGAAWVASVAGLLATAVLYLHHFPQREADARHGKRTPVVRLGPERAARLAPLLMLGPFALVALGVLAGHLPATALVCALALPVALRAARTLRSDPRDPRRTTRAFAETMGLLVAAGALLAAGLAAGALWIGGPPAG